MKDIYRIMDRLSNTRMKRIASQVEDKQKVLLKSDYKIIMDLVFLQEKKDILTKKEIKDATGSILVLFVLEMFRRNGFLKRNLKGIYSQTKIGRKLTQKGENKNG